MKNLPGEVLLYRLRRGSRKTPAGYSYDKPEDSIAESIKCIVLERERVFLLIDEGLKAPVSTTRLKEIHRKTQGWIAGFLLLLGEIKGNHLKNYSLKGYRFSVGRNMYCKKRFRRVNGYALIPEVIRNIEAEENNVETTRLVA